MLSLSSNCIEKITNLNGMSEHSTSDLVYHAVTFDLIPECRELEDSFTWSKPDQEPNWLGRVSALQTYFCLH